MSGEALLRFGVEVEVVLVPKKPSPNMKRFDLATIIANHHDKEFNTNTDVRMKALPENPGTILKEGGYKKWGLVKDGTIVNNKEDDYPMELVSPIFSFDQEGRWRDHIRKAFRSVESIAEIDTNISCGTHVHFFPGSGKHWTDDELREICHATLFFEGALLRLVPESRRDNVCASSSGLKNHLTKKEPLKCWQRINSMDREKRIEFMSPDGVAARFWSWNFRNMLASSDEPEHWTGYTIEWRLPPGVTTAEAYLMWAELGLNLIHAARQHGAHQALMDKEKRTVEYLQQFIEEFMDERASNPRYLEPVFTGKTGRFDPVPDSDKWTGNQKDKVDEQQLAMLLELRRENPWG